MIDELHVRRKDGLFIYSVLIFSNTEGCKPHLDFILNYFKVYFKLSF